MFLKVEGALSSKRESKKRLLEEREKSAELIKATEKARADIAGRIYENVIVDINGKTWMSRNTSNIILQVTDDVLTPRVGA